MQSHLFRLQPQTDLYQELANYTLKNNIQAAIVLSLIGSISQLALRFAGQSQVQLLVEDFEILQVSGTLSVSGLHLHGSFAKADGSILGGHLKQGSIIRTTAEIVLLEFPEWKMQRSLDQSTGYLELNLSKLK